MLCESTVEMARMAPSDVDMEAALMPISTQQPKNVGSCRAVDIDINIVDNHIEVST